MPQWLQWPRPSHRHPATRWLPPPRRDSHKHKRWLRREGPFVRHQGGGLPQVGQPAHLATQPKPPTQTESPSTNPRSPPCCEKGGLPDPQVCAHQTLARFSTRPSGDTHTRIHPTSTCREARRGKLPAAAPNRPMGFAPRGLHDRYEGRDRITVIIINLTSATTLDI